MSWRYLMCVLWQLWWWQFVQIFLAFTCGSPSMLVSRFWSVTVCKKRLANLPPRLSMTFFHTLFTWRMSAISDCRAKSRSGEIDIGSHLLVLSVPLFWILKGSKRVFVVSLQPLPMLSGFIREQTTCEEYKQNFLVCGANLVPSAWQPWNQARITYTVV